MKARKPYFRASCRAWYILWERKQVWLGRDRKEAADNLARLKAGQEIVRPNRAPATKSAQPTVREVVEAFLDFVKAERKEETYKWYKNYLKSFCEHVGDSLRVSALKPATVKEWITAKGWKQTSAHSAGRTVVACFNWAVNEDRLPATPLKGFKKAPPKSRTDCYVSPDDWKRLIAAVDDPEFRDAIVFLRLTGARPQECRAVEKRHFDSNIPAVVYPAEEAKGGKMERVIHLAGEAFLIVQKLSLRYPEGPIFRNADGTPWTKDAFARRFARLRKRLKMPQLIPYALRHTFATDSLIKGLDSLTVAELMGHKGTKMLEEVYQKIRKRRDHMKQAAERAVEDVG